MALRVLLPTRVWLASDHWVDPTLALASTQLVPPFNDTMTRWPLTRFWLNRPLMVWLAVWVMKSLPALPVSSLSAKLVMLGGAVLSTTMVLLLTKDRLPATSLA